MNFSNVARGIDCFFVITQVVTCLLSEAVYLIDRLSTLIVDPVGQGVKFVAFAQAGYLAEIGVGDIQVVCRKGRWHALDGIQRMGTV